MLKRIERSPERHDGRASSIRVNYVGMFMSTQQPASSISVVVFSATPQRQSALPQHVQSLTNTDL